MASAHEARLTKELQALELEYRKLARINHISVNATVVQKKRLEEIVSRMRSIRKTVTIACPADDKLVWLQEILDGKQPTWA